MMGKEKAVENILHLKMLISRSISYNAIEK